MSVSLQRGTTTGQEPVSLAEMKLHLRVDTDADDATITSLLVAARQRAEQVTGRTLVTSTWTYSLDSFPYSYLCSTLPAPARVTPDKLLSAWAKYQVIELPRAPLVSVESVKYVASADGQYVTLDPYRYVVDTSTQPGRIYPVLNTYWPTAQVVPNAVQITFTAGNNVPEPIKVAIRLICAYWYEQREDSAEVPKAAEYILSGYRVQPLGYVSG